MGKFSLFSKWMEILYMKQSEDDFLYAKQWSVTWLMLRFWDNFLWGDICAWRTTNLCLHE